MKNRVTVVTKAGELRPAGRAMLRRFELDPSPTLIWSSDAFYRTTYVQFIFADHTLDTVTRELRRSAVPVALEPQVFDLLVYLVENRERVVSKDDLLASVWHGRVVSESTLTSRINARRA